MCYSLFRIWKYSTHIVKLIIEVERGLVVKKFLLGIVLFLTFIGGASARNFYVYMDAPDTVVAGETFTVTISAKSHLISVHSVVGWFNHNPDDFTGLSITPLRDKWMANATFGKPSSSFVCYRAVHLGGECLFGKSDLFNMVFKANPTDVPKTSEIRFPNIHFMKCDDGEEVLWGELSKEITILPAQEEAINEPDAAKSSVNTLASLSVEGYSITPIFKSALTDYNVTVASNVTEVTVNATSTHNKASYKVNGNTNLIYGLNKVNVVVTAENGIKRTYTIEVNRLEGSSNNTLKELFITNGNMFPAFTSDILGYNVNVSKEQTKLDITALAADSKAKVEIQNNNLDIDGENIITVIVTADNMLIRTYILNVSMVEDSNNNKLSKLEIAGIDLNFDKNKTDYIISTNTSLEELVLNVKTEDENASYKVIFEDNKIKIVVTAVSGDTLTYEISNIVFSLPLLYIIIGTVLVLMAITGIFLYKKKRKK